MSSHAADPQASSGGAGGPSLPSSILIVATVSSLSATLLSLISIYTHLKRYLKPHLQRHVIRLLLIVPIYSTSSLIGLFSLPAAFLIDLIRDLYEAFAIYCFFELLVAYLGGERSTLILMIGRKPIDHPWPFKLILRELDLSDPYTFLAIKRGVMQYVQIKPVLALATVILKSVGRYKEGELAAGNGYTYISAIYNVSIFLSLYCLALFWSALSSELTPFRPTSKFLTVKGVVFATFWQGWAISVLVAAGLVKSIGPISDPDFLRLGLQDLLLTLEMPLFALGHMYAFSPRDYLDSWATHQARLPITYALRDALGARDVLEDIKGTMRGTGYGYARFEPAKGAVHQGVALSRRLRAGLRYTQGGKGKYFLPARGGPSSGFVGAGSGGGLGGTPDVANGGESMGTRPQGPISAVRRWIEDKRMRDEGYAPLTAEEAAQVVHENPEAEVEDETHGKDERRRRAEAAARRLGHNVEAGLFFFAADHPSHGGPGASGNGGAGGGDGDSDVSLEFHSPASTTSQEDIFAKARNLEHGDYAFPTIAYKTRKDDRGEEEWLLGGAASAASRSRSRDRRRRVEGWLEKMRGLIAGEASPGEEDDEDEDDDDQQGASSDADRDDAGASGVDMVQARGKRRGSSQGSKAAGGSGNSSSRGRSSQKGGAAPKGSRSDVQQEGQKKKKKETKKGKKEKEKKEKKSVWGGWASDSGGEGSSSGNGKVNENERQRGSEASKPSSETRAPDADAAREAKTKPASHPAQLPSSPRPQPSTRPSAASVASVLSNGTAASMAAKEPVTAVDIIVKAPADLDAPQQSTQSKAEESRREGTRKQAKPRTQTRTLPAEEEPLPEMAGAVDTRAAVQVDPPGATNAPTSTSGRERQGQSADQDSGTQGTVPAPSRDAPHSPNLAAEEEREQRQPPAMEVYQKHEWRWGDAPLGSASPRGEVDVEENPWA